MSEFSPVHPSDLAELPPPPSFARLFDAVAMGSYPWVARAFGYRFRVGTGAELERDGQSILQAVWGSKGLLPPPEAAHFAERYDRGTTWIVCYRGRKPVGVMGLLDMRVASVALDFENCLPPPALDLDTTREICRLAILPEHRGGSQIIMVGLLREMLAWSKRHGIKRLFSGSTGKLFEVYRRYNRTARLIAAPRAGTEEPLKARYYEKLRAYGSASGVIYTFEVAGASPWSVFSRFLTRTLKNEDLP